MAQAANVPIVLGYMDYEKKEVVMDHIFNITGNIDQDIENIKSFYKDKKGKHPENGVH